MAYKLYLDKNNLFECDIQLQGASLKSSFARIIVEGKEHSYIFKGEKRKKEKIIRFDKKENPFNKLLSLNIK